MRQPSTIESAPEPPQLLPPTPLNQGVLVVWSQVEGAKGYKLRVGTEKEKYASTINAGQLTSYRTWTLTNGQTYYFSVVAYNSKGESKPSNEVSAVPQAK